METAAYQASLRLPSPRKASLANLEAISQGELHSGLAEADIAYWAYNGGGPYLESGELENLSSIANLYPESVHVVVRRGSGITRISHLKGKRVSVGPEGSGASVHAKAIVEAYGLTLAELKVLHLQPGPASDLLREGGLDAFFIVAGYPVNAITSLAETMRIGLIDMTGEPVERLVIGYPFLTRGLIPAGTYKGVLRTPTLNVGAQWVVAQSVEADLVYDITRALWHENTRHLLDSGHPDGARIRLETALRGLAIPLHPGAERYYREIGMIQ